MSATATIPVVEIEGRKYTFSYPVWQFAQSDVSALGLKARLMTAEEAATMPAVLEYLLQKNDGTLKKI